GALAVAAGALYLLGFSEIALLLGAGAAGVLLKRPWKGAPAPAAALWWAGVPAGAAGAAKAAGFWPVFLYFLKIGSVLFGSGYVLLAFLRQGLVRDLGWLTDRQLMDAIAVGQFTPGPLFSTATFVGYVVGGWQGAVAASIGIFLPSFVFVWLSHPVLRRLRQSPWSAGFLDGVNAGSLGLMTGVTLQIARSALVDWKAWLILAAAAFCVFRLRANGAWIVVGAAVLGLLLWR
ncbi:MAG TPA: chromate transporter, partial [Armatimonadota bacterium]|nr:chromate transporter [Armatimonadota bacterium]